MNLLKLPSAIAKKIKAELFPLILLEIFLQFNGKKFTVYSSSSVLWGCFTAARSSKLVRIVRKMNTTKYRDLQDENLLQSTLDLISDGSFFNSTMTQGTRSRSQRLQNPCVNVLQLLREHPDLYLIEHVYRNVKMAAPNGA